MGTQMKAALGIVTVLLLFTICKSWIFDSDSALLKKVSDTLNLMHYFLYDPINDFVIIDLDLSIFLPFLRTRWTSVFRNRQSRKRTFVAFPTGMTH